MIAKVAFEHKFLFSEMEIW